MEAIIMKLPLHITADKREIKRFPQIAYGRFFYPRDDSQNGASLEYLGLKINGKVNE